jgi:diguanylate cyclase (GGDEF)-like protein
MKSGQAGKGDFMSLNKTGLTDRIFDAFAATATNKYIYICNMETGVSRWSKNAVEYFGLPSEYMLEAGEIWAEHIHPEDREMYKKDIDAVFAGKQQQHALEYRARNKDGNYVVCTCNGVVLHGDKGNPDLFAGTLINHGIIDNVDPVTSLYNLYEFLNQVRQHRSEKDKFCALMVGITQFKEINYAYSYAFGNSVLKAYGEQLKQMVRGYGSVFRMDAARFAMILNTTDPETVKRVYKRAVLLGKKLTVEGTKLPLDICGGAYILTSGNIGEYAVQSSITYAMEQSKYEKHGELVFFDSDVDGASLRDLELLSCLRRSVADNCRGFYLCYQPLIEARTGVVVGMEALARWHSEAYGEVSPGRFIPMLENEPCFYELSNWILEQALRDVARILPYKKDFFVNVNISYTQLQRHTFRDDVMAALDRTGVPPENLRLELTERCRQLNMDFLRGELNFFRNHGIRIVLDDFGTGTASLNLVAELPLDGMKIDQSFVLRILNQPANSVIVESTVGCANKLGVEVCLEGVENEQIRQFVLQYPVQLHQGFHYAKPMVIDKLLEELGLPIA